MEHTWLLQNEPVIRVSTFAGIAVIMALSEMASPKRGLNLKKTYRWIHNGGLILLNSVLVSILLSLSLVSLGAWIENQQWGLFQWIGSPLWLALPLSVVLLDFVVWAQHVMFHRIPLLWRMHRMHHADLDFDFTTGLRFHPLEILLSAGIKAGAIVLLGIPAIAVLIFEIILNGLAMFNHGNLAIPASVDQLLRLLIVTPDMHRVHHSWHRSETDSNYGFNLSCWDRLLGTYKSQPQDGHQGMTIGLRYFRNPRWERLDRMLIQPFIHPDRNTKRSPQNPNNPAR